MAKIVIRRQDGTPTALFYWSDQARADPARLPVYRNGSHGVERAKGLYFNALTNRVGRVSRP